MASWDLYGSDVYTIALGLAASAAALALVLMQGGGVGAISGSMGVTKAILLLTFVKSVGDLVRARWSSSVVVVMMDTTLASIAS